MIELFLEHPYTNYCIADRIISYDIFKTVSYLIDNNNFDILDPDNIHKFIDVRQLLILLDQTNEYDPQNLSMSKYIYKQAMQLPHINMILRILTSLNWCLIFMMHKGINTPPNTVLSQIQDIKFETYQQLLKRQEIIDYGGLVNFHNPHEVIKMMKELYDINISSTDKHYLAKIKHPVLNIISELREIEHNASFVKSITHSITKTNYNMISTMRLSSSNPNLHAIPTKHELAPFIKSIFKARSGYYFIEADYSQIELRVAAYIMNETKMKTVFQNNGDIHQSTADLLHISREAAKAVNFALIYLCSPNLLTNMLNVSYKEANYIYNSFFSNYTNIRDYQKTKQQEYNATNTSYVIYKDKILLTKHLTNIRACFNLPVQGLASIFTLISLGIFIKLFAAKKISFYPIHTIHDSIIFEVPDQVKFEDASSIIKTVMEQFDLDGIPLKINIKKGIDFNFAI